MGGGLPRYRSLVWAAPGWKALAEHAFNIAAQQQLQLQGRCILAQHASCAATAAARQISISSVSERAPPPRPVLCAVRRHAFGDQYRATDFVIDGPGKLEMTFTPQNGGEPQKFTIYDFKGGASPLRPVPRAPARASFTGLSRPMQPPALRRLLARSQPC